MDSTEEPPFTLDELSELGRRQQAAEGETPQSVARELRARLNRLRAEQGPEPVKPAERRTEPPSMGLEKRVAALEEELKRLRDRIEGKNG